MKNNIPRVTQSLADTRNANRRLSPRYDELLTSMLNLAEDTIGQLIRLNSDRGLSFAHFTIPTLDAAGESKVIEAEIAIRKEVQETLTITLRQLGYRAEPGTAMDVYVYWDAVSLYGNPRAL